MANDFCTDPNCKALWRFENGALIVDDIGTNTLTSNGAPETDLVDFQEGLAATHLDKIPADYFNITDVGLDAGFPLKNGDAIKKISVCFWIKFAALPSMLSFNYIFSKINSFRIAAYNTGAVSRIQIDIYNGGFNTYFHGGVLAVDTWYHVGVSYQDSDQRYRIQVWDDTAGAKLDVDRNGLAVNIAVTNDDLRISTDGLTGVHANLDEMVVFNRVLAETEIDEIKDGTFKFGGDLAVFGSLTNLFWFVKKSTGMLAKL